MDFSEHKKMSQTELNKLAEDIKNLHLRRDRIDQVLEEKITSLKANCPHKKTAIKHHYVEGSYLDKSQDHEITYCVLCGTELKDKVSYGWYG